MPDDTLRRSRERRTRQLVELVSEIAAAIRAEEAATEDGEREAAAALLRRLVLRLAAVVEGSTS